MTRILSSKSHNLSSNQNSKMNDNVYKLPPLDTILCQRMSIHALSLFPEHPIYSSHYHIKCFKATEGLYSPYYAAVCHQHCVATVRVLSCLPSPALRCSYCNIGRLCCDLKACNMVTAIIIIHSQAVISLPILRLRSSSIPHVFNA